MQKVILKTHIDLTIKNGVLHLNSKEGCMLRIAGLDPTLELYSEGYADSLMRWQAGE